MSDVSLGTAYITITATTKGMVNDINKALGSMGTAATTEGAKAGAKAGDGIKSGIASGAAKGVEIAKSALGALGRAGVAVGSACASGLASAVKAVADLASQSVKAYAEFEQLEGGAELAFGNAAGYVMEASRQAWRTAGMSQNEYLQQVNGFAVGLKMALGGDEYAAASLATRIIDAEADIAAATGVSSDMIQSAFNGIMKGNYTMLDNLQIGIVPTQEGFKQMIATVNEWNAANGNMTEYTIENVADCQAALLDYIQMIGYSGYAANEASSTIGGSVAAMKASWQNLILAFATGDIEGAMDDFLEAVETALNNILPVAEQVVDNIITYIPRFADKAIPLITKVVQKLVEILPTLLPMLIQALAQVIVVIAQALPDILPPLIQAAAEAITLLVQTLVEVIPSLIPVIFDAGKVLFGGLVDAVPTVLDGLGNALSGVTDFIGNTLSAAHDTLVTVGGYIMDGFTAGCQFAGEITKTFFGSLEDVLVSLLGEPGQWLIDAGKSVINGFLDGLKWAWDNVSGFIGGIGDWIVSHKGPPSYDATMLVQNGVLTMQGFGRGLESGFDRYVATAIDSANKSLASGIGGDIKASTPLGGDWRNVMGERPVIVFNDAILNDDLEMRQSALALLKDIRRAAVQ